MLKFLFNKNLDKYDKIQIKFCVEKDPNIDGRLIFFETLTHESHI